MEHTERAIMPALDFGGEGPDLVFLHANAYPPGCYQVLLDALTAEFHVGALLMRPLWNERAAPTIESWHILTADFRAWLRQSSASPVIATGHSMGAIVALRAALQDPGSFRALVLLDPVLVTRWGILAWRVMRRLRAGHSLHSAVRRAERRRTVFGDLDKVFEAYRPQHVFRRFTDDRLREVIGGLLEPADGHFRLRYDPTWEARIYSTAVWNDDDLWHGLSGLEVPTLIIRGEESHTLTSRACKAAQKTNPRIDVVTIEQATHLVALERPADVFAAAREFLRRRLALDHSKSGRTAN